MCFSVLISVYFRENPKFLQTALNSIWENQILKPSEIVLVEDGPLSKDLQEVINKASIQMPLNIIKLKHNVGLGTALNKGLLHCSNELIARMDSDDISVPDRFKKQVEYMIKHPEAAIISSDIEEFDSELNHVIGKRILPKSYHAILKFAKKRNPMNHMAIMFRKSAILDAGSYKPFPGYEDYYLWVRVLLKGYKAANINDVLVKVRAGNNMLARRQGIKFFKEEIRLQHEFKRLKFINNLEYYQNILQRAFPRLLPVFLLAKIYKALRK